MRLWTAARDIIVSGKCCVTWLLGLEGLRRKRGTAAELRYTCATVPRGTVCVREALQYRVGTVAYERERR